MKKSKAQPAFLLFLLCSIFSFGITKAEADTPTDAREITFPADMQAWGWLDVTKDGSQLITDASPQGCEMVLPNRTDQVAIDQTTRAIQCRLNNLGVDPSPGALYFPPGTYYINKTLSLTHGRWIPNNNDTQTYVNYGGGNRSGWTNEIHISGADPLTTKIVWAGDCGRSKDVPDQAVQKYNDILYINGMSPLTIERLTFDGQNCAGTALDMVSKPEAVSGVVINEMNFQNLKETGIMGDRTDLTWDEKRLKKEMRDPSNGMVSEVSITQSNFYHIGYAGILPNAANAVDWWIRDSTFHDCNIGVASNQSENTAFFKGVPQSKAKGGFTPENIDLDANFNHENIGTGGFQIANCFFENSRTADILGGSAVRNSFSLATRGPFVESWGTFLAKGNTVIASRGVIPVVSMGGQAGLNVGTLTLLNNKFVTQNDSPAVMVWTMIWGQPYPAAFTGANPIWGKLYNETYSNVTSIGNQYSSLHPFGTANYNDLQNNPNAITTKPGWAAGSALLQCGPTGSLDKPIDNRTYCNFSGPNYDPVFNLLTFADQLGANVDMATPSFASVRPIVRRDNIVVKLSPGATAETAKANSFSIQTAIDVLVKNQANCATTDDSCPEKWSIVFLPSGTFPIAKTVIIPGGSRIKIVGTGETNLSWFWSNSKPSPNTGTSAIFKFFAPAHVAVRDLRLRGTIFPGQDLLPAGEGMIVEVTDSPSSRIYSDTLRLVAPENSLGGSFSSLGIGDAVFEMRGFANSKQSSIIGNNATSGRNRGYFGYFGGNPVNLTVGGGVNLTLQDTWYEGGDSRFITCPDGDAANISVASSLISMGGWHTVHQDYLTTFNIGACATNTTILSSSIGRSGWSGLAPTQSLRLPTASTQQTHVLSLANAVINSTYEHSEDSVSNSSTSELDQGFLHVDADTGALHANIFTTFFQKVADNQNQNDGSQLAAKNTGMIDQNFISRMLGQVTNARQSAPSRFVTPILDYASTDVRIEHVWIEDTKLDLQFILPGAQDQ